MSELKYLTVSVLLLLLFPAVLLWAGLMLPPQYGHTFTGALADKVALLDQETEKTPSSRRIILLGGSAAAFGVNSRMIENSLANTRVINFGLYGALGTKLMLDLSRDSLRDGDIVIVMPEQEEQTLSLYFNGAQTLRAIDGNFGLVSRISFSDYDRLLGALPEFAADKLRYVFTHTTPLPEGVYSRYSFEEHGDIENAVAASNIMPGGYDSTMPVSFEDRIISQDFIDYLNEYADDAAARGARVWYHLPPINVLAVEASSLSETYWESLRQRLRIPLMGRPDESLMEAGWFYDTNFHLNQSGRDHFTCRLIRDIKAMLGDTSPATEEMKLALSLPMPPLTAHPPSDASAASSGSAQEQAVSLDDPYLILEYQNGSLALVGLTPEGRKQTSLTIPSQVALIHDNVFQDCTALRSIYLESKDPASLVVGQGLLDGCSADLYVPQEALTRYRTDYRFSQYARRIY